MFTSDRVFTALHVDVFVVLPDGSEVVPITLLFPRLGAGIVDSGFAWCK